MIHPVNLLSAATHDHEDRPILPCEPIEDRCAITGQQTHCIPRKYLLGKSFTNGDVLACPESNMVSIDAYYALKFKWERMSSWFCDGITFERLTRQDVRTKVFQEIMPEQWTAYATTSYKKHGALKAKVNTGKNRIWLFEMRLVDCSDRKQVLAWWDSLNIALHSGIGRRVLESLDCSPFVIQRVGLKTWIAFERWARPKYLSSLYAFLCYLLPSQEELKHE